MGIDRSNLRTGDLFLKRVDKDKRGKVSLLGWFIQQGISFFEWMLSRSPEFYHCGVIYDQYTAFETNPPSSRKFNISDLDDDFDKGLVCIIRPNKLSVGGEIACQRWMDNHIGLPYGLLTIGYEAELGTGIRLGLYKLVDWLRSKEAPLDWKHRPMCAQITALVLMAGGLSITFNGRGPGQIIPGDYYCMTQIFTVIQDGKK